MNLKPLVSVVIPTFNYAIYLPRAIESVLAQTYKEIELIVVDDGSTDNTTSVIQTLQAKYHGRICYVQQKNSGPNAARNNGIDKAQGDFIALLDADDEWLPEKLEKQVKFAIANPQFGIIGCGSRRVRGDGVILAENFGVIPPPRNELIHHLMVRNYRFGGSSGVFIRKECFKVVGLFDESLRGSEDRDMWLRIVRKYEVTNLKDILINIHYHQNNCSSNSDIMLKSKLLFIDKHFKFESFAFRQRAISFAFLDAAHESFKASKFLISIVYSCLAICSFPMKSVPDDDKYQILIKSILPNRLLSLIRSKNSSH
jgi:glycosyltransferase involved in cell wall biosynthesis